MNIILLAGHSHKPNASEALELAPLAQHAKLESIHSYSEIESVTALPHPKKYLDRLPFCGPSETNKIKIDLYIDQLTSWGHSVIVVLGDCWADDILRSSRSLDKCELAFDTWGTEATLATNLQAGLFAVSQFCGVLPISCPLPSKKTWQNLFHHHYKMTTAHKGPEIIQSFHIKQGQAIATYPIIVREPGLHTIRSLKKLSNLQDSGLTHSAFPLLEASYAPAA